MPALPPPPQPQPSAYEAPADLAALRAQVRRSLAHLASPKGHADSKALRLKLSQHKVDGPQTVALKRSLVEEDHDPLEDTACPDYAKP